MKCGHCLGDEFVAEGSGQAVTVPVRCLRCGKIHALVLPADFKIVVDGDDGDGDGD